MSIDIQNINPRTINLETENLDAAFQEIGRQGDKALAAVGIDRDGKKAHIAVLPKSAIEMARKKGQAKRFIPFSDTALYFAALTAIGDAEAVIGEQEIEYTPAFNEVADKLLKYFGRTTVMARRPGATKLLARMPGGKKRFHELSSSRSTQLAGRVVGNRFVVTTGGPIRHTSVNQIVKLARGEQISLDWQEIDEVPDYVVQGEATMGRLYGRGTVLGLKDGRVANVALQSAGELVRADFTDAVPTEIEGSTLGLLEGEEDIAFSIDADKSGAVVTLKRLDTLPEQVQRMLTGKAL